MLCKVLQQNIFLFFIFVFINVSGAFVGVNIGLEMSNIPPETDIVSILKAQKIGHVRLFNADPKILGALANTGIQVIVGVPNDQLLRVGESKVEAANWVKKNVASFLPATNITHIAVGNEVLTTIPNAALVLVPAMQFLRAALVASNLDFQVKISTPHSMDMIPKAFPPSTATFNSTWDTIITQMLQFLKSSNSTFMINAQPYHGYIQANGVYPLEYALFRPLSPNKQIVDPNTGFHYNNMFDAMIDATYNSIQALNASGVPVLVTESGWPTHGGDDEPYATLDNALVYNSNLIRHVLSGSGTPAQPNATISAYIYELFNEDQRKGAISEMNWGLFSPNGTAMYSVSFIDIAGLQTNSSAMVGMFCVANENAETTALQAGLNWACGPGAANCSTIQPGQPCYDSDLAVVASYAYNDYYHRTQVIGGTCNFGNTAAMTTTDPSHGSCIFAGSSGYNRSSGLASPLAPGPISPESGVSTLKCPCIVFLISTILFTSTLF